MPNPDLHLPLLGPPGEPCPSCGTPLAGDQRYCLECGCRRGPARLDPLAHARGAAGGAAAALVAPAATAADGAALSSVPALRALGQPRVLAIAAMLVLGFGVAVGAAAGPPSATGLPPGAPRILVAATPAPAAPAASDGTAADVPVTDPATDDTSTAAGDVTTADTATAAADTPAPAATTPDATPSDTPDTPATPATPEPPAPVKHVWVVPLTQAPADVPFSPGATTPVVPDLAQQGTVLTGYSSIAPGSLANRIAMISGQAPTAATLGECAVYAPVTPGTIAKTGLVKGDGCLYPAKTVTLADQLTGAGLAWKGYFEDMGAAPPPADTSCRRPEQGQADPFALPRPGDAYLTRSDPFVFFRSITESPDCGSNVVGLDRLGPDLAKADLTPAFSFIAPNACHDGSAVPCAAGAESGATAASAWLGTVIPQITASPAYADGGLIVITFDGAPAPAAPAPEPKGSKVGALLLSPYVGAGTQIGTAYDHYALLKTIERLFGLPALGHAADDGVTAFGAKVFANAPAAGSD